MRVLLDGLAVVGSLLNPAQGFSAEGPGGMQGFLSPSLRKLSQNAPSFWVLLFLRKNKMMKQFSFTRTLFSTSVVSLLKLCKWACKPGRRKCK